MKNLFVRFVRGTGWDSKIIEWTTRSKWSHVEFLEADLTFGAQLAGGVRWRTIHDRCYKKVQDAEVWQVPVTDEEYDKFLAFIVETEGRDYNWRAIVSFALGPYNWDKLGTDICSEEVANGLKAVGRIRLDLPSENYTPRDIWMLLPLIPGSRKVMP